METNTEAPKVRARSFSEAQVREHIGNLTHDHAQVLNLHHLQGLDYEKIAEQIGKPVGTVKSRLHRARAILADLIDGTQAAA